MEDSSVSVLNRAALLGILRTRLLGRSLLLLDSCGSTNDVARKAAIDGAPHGFVVLSEKQVSGRGRHGRYWISPRGGIWMTVLLRPPLLADSSNSLGLIGAIAVARGLHMECNVAARVRWPNDVVVDDRKLAGVLVEAKLKGNELEYALMGMGINANFPVDLLQSAVENSATLLGLVRFPICREKVVSSILYELEHLHELWISNDIPAIVRLLEEIECSRGRLVKATVPWGLVSGVFEGYDGLGKVRVVTDAGRIATIETGSVVSVEYPVD